MAVTWRKRSQNGLKWRKIKIWGHFGGIGRQNSSFCPPKPKKCSFGEIWKIFTFFFLNFGRKKKPFWTKKGPILAQKQVSKIFFSRPIWGAKTFPHLYLTNLAAAIAAVTTKLTLIETPYLAGNSGAKFFQGPCGAGNPC